MAFMPSNSASWIGYPHTPSTGGTWTTTTVTYTTPSADLYLVDCLHCGEKFVTKSRKTTACIESMETCWDVECPKCNQEIRLCLHECKHDCAHALDCILVGILDKVLEKGIKLEFEKGAEVYRVPPFQSGETYYPWNQPVYGYPNPPVYGYPTPNITWGNGMDNSTYNPPFTAASDTVAISFVDKLKEFLALKTDNRKE